MNYMETAMAPAEAKYAAAVIEETWGHLNPKRGSKTNGWIVWTVGVHGTEVVDYEFEGLGGSPDLYEDIHEFIYGQNHLDVGIWRWDGWYKKFKNRNCQFQSVNLQLIPHTKEKPCTSR